MQGKTLLLASLLAALPGIAFPQTISDTIDSWFAWSTGWFVGFIFSSFPGTDTPWIVGWLVVAAVVFTLYFGFIQFRVFGHAIALVMGRYSDPRHMGEVSHFQA